MMKNQATLIMFLGIVLSCACQQVWAGSFDIGVGLGFADSQDSEGFEGGWDLQAGYEGRTTDNWNIGGQVHLINGWTDKNDIDAYHDTRMYFHSTALYATARPQSEMFQWLQLKGGVVSADYKSMTLEGSGTGMALGVGVVVGGETLRVHLLDVYRYQVGGHSFNVYTFSIGVLFDLIVQ